MQALTYIGNSQIEWQGIAPPRLEATDVIVRPLAVARCDLDPAMVTTNLFPGPYTVGHEFVGEIRQVGEAVNRWSVGDRVIAPFQVSCGGCTPCTNGRFAACATHRAPAGSAFGFGPLAGDHGGAMAELVRVPHADHMLLKAPKNIAIEALASLSDNVTDAYRSVSIPLQEQPGSDILILGGAGDSLAYYMIQWAHLLGAASVRYADTSDTRCGIAEALGAKVQKIDPPWPNRLERSPITITYTTDADGLRAGIRSTEDYGFCMSTAVPVSLMTEFPLLAMYTKGITFHTSRADTLRFLPDVIDHVTAERFDPLQTPTKVVAMNQADEEWATPGIKLIATT